MMRLPLVMILFLQFCRFNICQTTTDYAVPTVSNGIQTDQSNQSLKNQLEYSIKSTTLGTRFTIDDDLDNSSPIKSIDPTIIGGENPNKSLSTNVTDSYKIISRLNPIGRISSSTTSKEENNFYDIQMQIIVFLLDRVEKKNPKQRINKESNRNSNIYQNESMYQSLKAHRDPYKNQDQSQYRNQNKDVTISLANFKRYSNKPTNHQKSSNSVRPTKDLFEKLMDQKNVIKTLQNHSQFQTSPQKPALKDSNSPISKSSLLPKLNSFQSTDKPTIKFSTTKNGKGYTYSKFKSTESLTNFIKYSNKPTNHQKSSNSVRPKKDLLEKFMNQKNVFKTLQNHSQFQTIPQILVTKNSASSISKSNSLMKLNSLQNIEKTRIKFSTTQTGNGYTYSKSNLDIKQFLRNRKQTYVDRQIPTLTTIPTFNLPAIRLSPWKIRDIRISSGSFETVCNLDKDEGSGSDSYSSWYFNKETGSCEWFSYKGDEGNGNRFLYRANCEHSCIEKYENFCNREEIVNCGEHWLRCQMESDTYCEDIGIKSNLNVTLYCPPPQPICINIRQNIRKPPNYLTHRSAIPADCFLPKDPGPCHKSSSSPLVYYYDSDLNDCLGFLYSNCGGNFNRYPSKSYCMNRCAI